MENFVTLFWWRFSTVTQWGRRH